MTNPTTPVAMTDDAQVNGHTPTQPSPEVLANIQELRTRGCAKASGRW